LPRSNQKRRKQADEHGRNQRRFGEHGEFGGINSSFWTRKMLINLFGSLKFAKHWPKRDSDKICLGKI
jgi:hypothetical protein